MDSIWIEAVILGLVQGLTEFLPVSSSAHLRIVGALLPSGRDPGAAFTAITQIGTEIAVLIYFRREIWRIAVAWLGALRGGEKTAEARLGWLVILGTLPIVVLGLIFKSSIETDWRSLYITALMLIIFGLLLGIADHFGVRRRALDEMNLKDGILLGLAQALALVPGVSRSGGTISAGLALGFSREAAARYSFLLAVPAVMASGLYQLLKSWGQFGPIGPGPTLLATMIAFAVGYGVIIAFLQIVSRHSYLPFILYRLGLGWILLVMLASGALVTR